MEVKIEGRNFLSFDYFDIKSGNDKNMVLLLGQNKSGKTQILKLLYSYLYMFVIKSVSPPGDIRKLLSVFPNNTMSKDFLKNDKNNSEITITINEMELIWNTSKNSENVWELDVEFKKCNKNVSELPVFISPNGFGDYYRGFFAASKFYQKKVFSDSLTDLINDFMVIYEAGERESEKSRFIEEMDFLKNNIGATFKIQNNSIMAIEKDKVYYIEEVASGLKTFAPLYLAMKYELIKDSLIIDEPEVSLHPAWVTVMAEVLYKISKKGVKVFVATHSEFFIEKINVFLKKDGDFDVGVWKFETTETGAIAKNLEIEDREISPRDYLEVYYDLIKEL